MEKYIRWHTQQNSVLYDKSFFLEFNAKYIIIGEGR
jgi:hypothetical protein